MLGNNLKINNQPEIEAMFLKHYQEWCLLSYSYIENMSEVEDMVQDVFVKILRRKPKNEILDLKNYISTAVKNNSLKRIKRNRKLEKLENSNVISSPSYEEYLIETETKIKVQKAMEVLPEQSKKVFQLCVLDGEKYQNAADSLGISINTVKFHLKKSFKILRLALRNTYA
ncbi:RNA polymerase sigma factor [Aquimarina algiphila]|uniref:Sigma-70 family RNA polymerase sigma factor n=1 Tax=Aquimarina algiphila TaxID=2047982 RepID=A0A554VF03_9FLAO|nr:sigma-70 family RNA polymerase sigma factor [Aquimarina algiphila]TSE05699.1 sigma-70 family RNA polymerase sigma factor [Aquimarina algiphila]